MDSGFQSTINIFNALGVPGDMALDGPLRVAPYNLCSGSGCDNVVGYVYTIASGGNPDPSGNSSNAGVAQVGGSGVVAGILVNSKEYAAYATCSSGIALDPTLILPNQTIGQIMSMGYVFVNVDAAASVGDSLYYSEADGSISVSSGSGKTQIPNAVVDRYDVAAAGLALIKLTN